MDISFPDILATVCDKHKKDYLTITQIKKSLPKGVEQATTDWKAANATNGQFKRGHADLLQWELDQARKRTSPAAGAQP